MNPLDPKAAEGAKKTQLHLLPPVALAEAAKAHQQGGVKYGPYNWRHTKVCATTYISAMMRHLDLWRDGEDLAPDSGVSHLGHIIASANILLDAAHCGTLVDDRPKMLDQTGRFRGMLVNPDYKDAEEKKEADLTLRRDSVSLRCRVCGDVFERKLTDPLAGSDICDPCKVKQVSRETFYPGPPKPGPFTGKIAASIEEDPNWRKTDHGFVWKGPPVPLDFAEPLYRMLDAGENIQMGDERVSRSDSTALWQFVDAREIGFPLTVASVGCYRRPLTSVVLNPGDAPQTFTADPDFAVPTGMNGIQSGADL